jgi:hypothetical protein
MVHKWYAILIYNAYFGFYFSLFFPFSLFFFFLFLEFKFEGGEGGWLLGRATLLKGATPVIIISILRIVTVVTDLFSGNNCYCIY